jgi:BlaR1 peptidase M56
VEREFLLTVLILLLGGLTLQCFAAWPRRNDTAAASRRLERLQWLALWRPAAPTLVVAAWLCGWALSQPDPVLDPVGPLLFIACAPFGMVILRAVARALWSLARSPGDCGVAAVGLFRPHIVFSPQLAKQLDDRAMEAALAHEHAHIRHRDPLRIWLAQFATDLQWPWASAQKRFRAWLAALECARDDEARAAGIDGPDLAAAVLASLRFHSGVLAGRGAHLIGEASTLEERVARLLRPLPQPSQDGSPSLKRLALLLTTAVLLSVALGIAFGERILKPLLAFGS